MTTRFRVTRDVAGYEMYNWAGRDVAKGEEFDEFTGPTYGACDTRHGVILEGPGHTFFEFPRDAVEELPPPVCGGALIETARP